MKVLDDLGVFFLNDVALRVFEQHGCDLAWDNKRVQMGSCFCNGKGGEGALKYFNLVTSLLIQLRAAKPKAAFRQIFSKDIRSG